MRRLLEGILLLVMTVVVQVAVYYTVKFTASFIQMFPPYSFIREDINLILLHTVGAVGALIVTLFGFISIKDYFEGR